MPMTFFAGVHGFAYFVPYLLVVATIAGVGQWMKRGKRVVAAVAVGGEVGTIEVAAA